MLAMSPLADILLALDVGEARIGLARGERGSRFAFGRGYLQRRKLSEDIAAIAAIMREEGAELLVIGLPRRSDGGESAQTKRVRAFAAQLEAQGLPYCFEDERFTTRIASAAIAKSSLAKKKRREKGRLDEAAAVLILETYLAKQSPPPTQP